MSKFYEIILSDGKEGDTYEFEYVGKIIRILLPVIGKPNYGVFGDNKAIGWKFDSVTQFAKAVIALDSQGIVISSEDPLRIKMLTDKDLNPSSFYTSDDPALAQTKRRVQS